jgi:hypothetical protein
MYVRNITPRQKLEITQPEMSSPSSQKPVFCVYTVTSFCFTISQCDSFSVVFPLAVQQNCTPLHATRLIWTNQTAHLCYTARLTFLVLRPENYIASATSWSLVLPTVVCLKSVIVKPRKMRRPRHPKRGFWAIKKITLRSVYTKLFVMKFLPFHSGN